MSDYFWLSPRVLRSEPVTLSQKKVYRMLLEGTALKETGINTLKVQSGGEES